MRVVVVGATGNVGTSVVEVLSADEQVVAIAPILREVEGRVLEDGDEIGEALHHLLATTELVGIVEVRHVGQFGPLRFG